METRRRTNLASRRARSLLASVAVASMLCAVPAAQATPTAAVTTPVGATVHTVVMGAVDPALPDPSPRPPATAGRSDRFEYLAYYPDHLRVHRGDTVRFRRDGFHTVMFSPAAEPRRGWLRRDEGEGVSAVAHRDPSQACGHDPGIPSCVLSSTSQVVASGWDDLALTVELGEGTYDYYCNLHEGMQGALEVVADSEPLPSPDEIERARAEQVAADTATAAALLAANQSPTVEVAGGHLRWTVKAGDITADDRVAILRYMPASVQVAPGDEVVFAVPRRGAAPAGRIEAATEIHTATFPHDPAVAPFGLLRYLNPSCDADGEASGAPGVPAMYPALVAGCPPATTPELLMQPWAWRSPTRAPDDAVMSPLTVHDSGLLAPGNFGCRTACDPWTGETFPSQGPATTFPNAGTFSFVCLVHPEWGMAGSITVGG